MSQPASKITLQDAMEQLNSMFPQIDPQLMKDMLYATKGRMERTIELLLDYQETGALPAGLVRSSSQAVSSPTAASQRVASSPVDSSRRDLSFEYGFPEERRYRPTVDDEFLRVPNRPRSSSAPALPPAAQRSDEQMARELQRQMMLEEVLTNNGLIPSQRSRQGSQRPMSPQTDTSNRIGTMGYGQQGMGYSSSNAQQQQRNRAATSDGISLGKLSEMAKKKLASFRSRFAGNRSGRGSSQSAADSLAQHEYSTLNQNDPDGFDDDDADFGRGNRRFSPDDEYPFKLHSSTHLPPPSSFMKPQHAWRQDEIDMMLDLRKKGKTNGEIAEILNSKFGNGRTTVSVMTRYSRLNNSSGTGRGGTRRRKHSVAAAVESAESSSGSDSDSDDEETRNKKSSRQQENEDSNSDNSDDDENGEGAGSGAQARVWSEEELIRLVRGYDTCATWLEVAKVVGTRSHFSCVAKYKNLQRRSRPYLTQLRAKSKNQVLASSSSSGSASASTTAAAAAAKATNGKKSIAAVATFASSDDDSSDSDNDESEKAAATAAASSKKHISLKQRQQSFGMQEWTREEEETLMKLYDDYSKEVDGKGKKVSQAKKIEYANKKMGGTRSVAACRNRVVMLLKQRRLHARPSNDTSSTTAAAEQNSDGESGSSDEDEECEEAQEEEAAAKRRRLQEQQAASTSSAPPVTPPFQRIRPQQQQSTPASYHSNQTPLSYGTPLSAVSQPSPAVDIRQYRSSSAGHKWSFLSKLSAGSQPASSSLVSNAPATAAAAVRLHVAIVSNGNTVPGTLRVNLASNLSFADAMTSLASRVQGGAHSKYADQIRRLQRISYEFSGQRVTCESEEQWQIFKEDFAANQLGYAATVYLQV